MTLISQHVDTFKESLYLHGDCAKYNQFVNELIDLKEQAQEIKDINNDNRFIVKYIGSHKFKVMATSITGYSVVIKNADCSIALKKRGDVKTDLNPSVKIEYRAKFLVSYGLKEAHKKLNDFFSQYFHSDYLSKTPEIHICADVQGHTFNLLDVAHFKTRSQKIKVHDGDDEHIGRQMVFSSRKMETLYLGTSNFMLRIYNKTKEISKTIESGHIEQLWELNSDYNRDRDVWRIEFQIRRPILKQLFDIDSNPFDCTLCLLDKIPELWSYCHKYFNYKLLTQDETLSIITGIRKFKNGNEKLLTKEAERKILSRSPIHPLWEKIQFFNAIQPEYIFRFKQVVKTEPKYALNAVCALISTTMKHYGEITPEIIETVFELAEQRSQNNNDINLIDKAVLKKDEYFATIEKQRKLGLNIIDINDGIKDNLGLYCVDAVSPILESRTLKQIY